MGWALGGARDAGEDGWVGITRRARVEHKPNLDLPAKVVLGRLDDRPVSKGGNTMRRLLLGLAALASLSAVFLDSVAPADAAVVCARGYRGAGCAATRPVVAPRPVVVAPRPVVVAPAPVVVAPRAGVVCRQYGVVGGVRRCIRY
jgi:hypothetical protein